MECNKSTTASKASKSMQSTQPTAPQTNGNSESVDVMHNNNNDNAINCSSAECLSNDSTIIVNNNLNECENVNEKIVISSINDETIENDEIFDFSSSDLSDNENIDKSASITHPSTNDESKKSINGSECSELNVALPPESTPHKDPNSIQTHSDDSKEQKDENDHSVEHYVDSTLKAINLNKDMASILSNEDESNDSQNTEINQNNSQDNVSDCAEADEEYGEEEAIFHFLGKANEVVCD